MSASHSQDRRAQLLLRYPSLLAKLRRVPLLGRCVSWAGAKLVPRDSLTWVQVQSGPAQGLWLHLNPRTGKIYFEGGVEPEVQEVLQQHLRLGMTFCDVGANIGFFSLPAARLRDHVERNAFGWITVEQKAVWSKPGPGFFARTDPAASPDRGLGHVVSSATGDTIQAAGISLDDYARTQAAPDFFKCDVEGAEVEVFRGAERLLKEKRPGMICEMHSEANQRVLLEEFSRLGYACQPCGANHILALPR